jgi:anaerobic selenocysteine-containing dehydrogenase
VFGRRDILFMNEADLVARGLEHGDKVDVAVVTPDGAGNGPVVQGLTAIAYDIPRGSVAAYYPEANILVALADHDKRSGTPAYKSVPVRVQAAA